MCVSTEARVVTLKSAAAVLTLCSILNGSVHAGPVTVEAPAPAPAPVPASQPTPTSTAVPASRLPSIPAQARSVEGYQVRCWQHGKLVIDEFRTGAMPEGPKLPDELLRLPSAGAASGGGSGTISARNATCFIKPQSRTAANLVLSLP
jgi:hypothetical protein